ncbi:MAG: hypothetical protein ABR586_09940 [Thermoplasmatota archaeon]
MGGQVPLRLVFLASCALLAFAFQPSEYLNDELVQAASLDGLAHGHIWVSGDLPGYAKFVTPIVWGNETAIYGHYLMPAPGHIAAPAGSTMLTFLALPVLGVLTALHALLGLHAAVALPALAMCVAGAWATLRWLGASPLAQALACLGVAASFWPVASAADWPLQPTLDWSALIWISILATGVAAAYLFDLLRGWVGQGGALLGTAGFLATPVAFWAETAKYSSLSVCLLVLALWCLREGARTPPLRVALAFCLAGLAVWNQLPWGVLLAFALGVVLLGAVRLGARAFWTRAGAATAGLAVGLLPEALTRILLHRAGLESQYGPTGTGGLGSYLAAQTQPGGLLAFSVLSDPAAPFTSAFSTFFWTQWRELRYALPFLAMAPLAAVALCALLRRRLRLPLPSSIVVFTVAYLVAVFLVLGKQFVNIGGGPDMRYGITFWPLLAILSAPTLADVAARRGVRWAAVAATYGLLALLLVTVALNLGAHAAHQNLTPEGIMHDQTAVLRYGGLALSALLAVLLLAGDRLPLRFPWRDHAVCVALGVGAGVQLLLLGFDNGGGPFAAWPVDLLSQGLRWILFRHWPQYGI